MADIGTMQEQLQALEAQLGSSVSMVAAFDGELARMRETMVFTGREVNTLSSGISGGLRLRLACGQCNRQQAGKHADQSWRKQGWHRNHRKKVTTSTRTKTFPPRGHAHSSSSPDARASSPRGTWRAAHMLSTRFG